MTPKRGVRLRKVGFSRGGLKVGTPLTVVWYHPPCGRKFKERLIFVLVYKRALFFRPEWGMVALRATNEPAVVFFGAQGGKPEAALERQRQHSSSAAAVVGASTGGR